MQQGSTEWLAARRSGIGGSEVAALFGVCPWDSAYSLWHRKVTGSIEAERNAWVRAGSYMEPGIRDGYAIETGRVVTPGVTMARNLEVSPYLFANTDGTVEDPKHPEIGPGVLDCKLVLVHAYRRDWLGGVEFGVPLHVQLQVQTYMMILGLRWASIAVFVAGDSTPLKSIDLWPDPVLQRKIAAAAERFWCCHVLTGIPPIPDGSDATTRAIARAWPRTTAGSVVNVPAWLADMAMEYFTLGRDLARIEDRRAELRNQILGCMRNHVFGRFPDGSGFSARSAANGSRTLRSVSKDAIDRALAAANKW
jgi:putative phage-type endonuclease